MNNNKCHRVVLTGGPGGGKTTAGDLFRRELGPQVVLVPEAATLLFAGGFPRSKELSIQKLTQKTIYHVQKNLEDIQSEHYQGRVLICDRGTLDGAAYWPTDANEYFKVIDSSLEEELSRYDAVLFFETAAKGGASIEGGNPYRFENLDQAVEIDDKLKKIWSQHPKFILIPHNDSFLSKMNHGVRTLKNLFSHLNGK